MQFVGHGLDTPGPTATAHGFWCHGDPLCPHPSWKCRIIKSDMLSEYVCVSGSHKGESEGVIYGREEKGKGRVQFDYYCAII